MKITAIIPVYNALNDVKLCLESIIDKFNFELGEVIVINDYSNNKTTDYLRTITKKNPKIQLIENTDNLGFVKTCNKGMKIANGDIVVLLNSDTKIPTEFCERIIKCFETDKEIGIASPIGSYTNAYYIRLPKNYTIEKINKLLQKKHVCSYPLIPAAEGFCYCIRQKVIKQQGYFDEVFGKGYHEETDYSYRAITNGWKNVLIDNLYVYHKRQASFGAETRKKLLQQNNPLFFERWGNFRKLYEKEHKLKNPVILIEQEIFPNKRPNSCIRTPLEYLFSIKNSNNKEQKIITVAGLQFKIKNKYYIQEQRIENLEKNLQEQNKKIITNLSEKIDRLQTYNSNVDGINGMIKKYL